MAPPDERHVEAPVAAVTVDDTGVPAQTAGGPADAVPGNCHDSVQRPDGQPENFTDALIEWVRQYGGEVNVDIKRAGESAGLGTYAKRDFQRGDVLLRVPVELTYVVDYDLYGGVEGASAQLVLDMGRKDSFWAPLFRALPTRHQVLNLAMFPQSYLTPIIQDNNTEVAIKLIQKYTDFNCQQWQPKYKELGLNVTTADCRHAVALVLTRDFYYGGKSILLPILDFANHENSCVHTHTVEPCDAELGYKQWAEGLPPPDPINIGCGFNNNTNTTAAGTASSSSSSSSSSNSNQWCTARRQQNSGGGGHCLVWRAGKHLPAGQEVCNTYGTLLQDHTLFQYGFLQAGPVVHELSMMDRPEHSERFEDVWDKLPTPWGQAVPDKFTGTRKQLRHEAARLRARLEVLTAGNAAAAAVLPDDALDPDGSILSLMREWRRQRLDAIAAEIQRLDEAVQGVDEA